MISTILRFISSDKPSGSPVEVPPGNLGSRVVVTTSDKGSVTFEKISSLVSNLLPKNASVKSSFCFEKNVDENVFKKVLDFYGHDPKTMSKADLQQIFPEMVIEYIAKERSVDFSILKRYGFVSQGALQSFLKDPSIIEQLKKQVVIPEQRLSKSLLSDLKRTYQNAVQSQSFIEDVVQGRITGTEVLVTLFDIFQFIQNRSDEEIAILEKYLTPWDLHGYLHGYSLQTFKNDLKIMDALSFEIKYEGCFNGMLESVIKPILDAEELFRFLS